jgi:hypothetical protein
MDLNHLYHREQVSLMQAERADGVEARLAYRGLAAGYAARIVTLRESTGASGFGVEGEAHV